ncbi:maleylpyruvate isomerase N-terminal domain-containing protein [Streptomyces sp. NBC_00424]|uniref:maleylpyruvate isomerase N-terminal domain-containing protein n=1 Tax=Streptomyces sp. NBC_00424 TaxID=2903648 RepID=UPI00338E3551
MRTRARGATPGPPPSPQDLPPRPSPQLRDPRPYLGNAKHRRLVGRLDSELLDALRKAGPDRGCRTWWGTSQSPLTCGAVARHRLQEIAVHTYDAQVTAGAPQSLPDAAGRCRTRRQSTVSRSSCPPAARRRALAAHAHRLRLPRHRGALLAPYGRRDGARFTRLPAPGATPEATLGTTRATAADEGPAAAGVSVRGTASELVLFCTTVPRRGRVVNGVNGVNAVNDPPPWRHHLMPLPNTRTTVRLASDTPTRSGEDPQER